MKKIILFAAALFLFASSFATQLNGTYTIDPAGTASATVFKNFSSAITYLNSTSARSDGGPANTGTVGVSGPVIFNIAPGNYNELISMYITTGASLVNTITFQKNPALSGDVVFNATQTSGLGIWNMNSSAKFITFKNLTFRPTITSTSTTISYIIGWGTNITVDNVVFDNANCVNSNRYDLYNLNELVVTNSTFFNSAAITTYRGSAVRVCNGVTFTNNTVKNTQFWVAGARQINNNLFRQCALDIASEVSASSYFLDNTLDNATVNFSAVFAGMNIERNKVNISQRYFDSPASGTQIGSPFYFGSSGYSQGTARVVNNFISINQNGLSIGASGIYVTNNPYMVQLFHNTVSVNASQTDLYAVNAQFTVNITAKNNIFNNTGGMRAANGTNGTWDYNNYYATVTPAYSMTDAHAGTQKINFVSATDLHHNNACLRGASLGITTDIDNVSRNAATPVIGATESAGIPVDGSISRILSPTSQYQYGTSTQPIAIRVKNFGNTAISSVSANYILNGGAPVSQTFSGLSIAPCDSASVSFTPSAVFPQNRTSILAYLTEVNGSADPNILNDSARFNVDVLAPMHGIYTVNPAAASTPFNFQRIGEADSALTARSIDGAVEIQIYNGTYNEPNITLGVVGGSSAANTIKFTSYSGDSVQTIIPTAFNITGTSFVQLTKLNFDIVNIVGNVSDIRITNNQLRQLNYSAGNNLVLNYNYIKPQNAFNNQTQPRGAITIESNTAAQLTGVEIKANIFKQLLNIVNAGVGVTGASWGIQLRRIARPTIENNIFRNINMTNVGYALIGCCSYSPYPYGATIQYRQCTDTAFIQGNKFEGIHTTQFTEDSISNLKLVIRNNFFTVTDQLQFSGLSTQLYYNNFNVVGTGNGALLSSNITACVNNVFASTNGQRVITFDTAPATWDYNDLYTSGAVLARKLQSPSNIDYPTFTAFKTGTGTNLNGKNASPKYTDSLDLHVAHPMLLATGTPWPAADPILKDIDNDNRNQLNPCIGADEFTPPSADVIAQQYIGPKINFTAGTPAPLAIKIKNNGSANLNQVKVRWSLNGVEQLPPYNWTGDVAYDSTTTIAFGTQLFDMLKYNSLKIWTELPNNATDMVPVNDTLRIDSIMPYARGAFTLGGSVPTFPTFTKGSELLVYGGIDSAVNIAVRNGKYTEQAIMKYVRGVSETNMISFRGENNSASLDTLSFSSVTSPVFTMRLDSAAFYSFKNISFQSLTNNSKEIEFTRKTRFITFDSCVFTATSTSPSNAHIEGTTLNSLPQVDSNVVFTNNRFTGGYSGIQLPLRNGVIKGNRFDNMVAGNSSFGAIHLTGSFAPLGNSLLIDSNYFSNTIACTYAIGNTCYIYGYNTISGINISSTSADNNIVISNNRLSVISRTGIIISSPGTAARPVKIFNNLISTRNGTPAITSTGAYTEIMHNSFADSANGNSNLVELRGANTTFKNNILIKGIPGNPVSASANLLNVTAGIVSTLVSTNNAYGIPDSTKTIYNGSANVTLSQWKATGKDANSVKATAAFVNIFDNLHIDKNKAGALDVINKGTPISYVPKDIDDSTRSTITPAIGADEFMLNAIDGGITALTSPALPVAPGISPVVLSVRNFGDQTITSAQVNWTVNGAAQSPFTYTGSFVTGDSVTGINIGSYNFNQPVGYTLKVWLQNINGSPDLNHTNDTVTRVIYPALCGSYTVGGASPDFITPKAAMNYASLAGVTCPVVFNIRDGLYLESDTLNAVLGTSAINTLTIQSESLDSSKVTLYLTDFGTSTSNPVLKIDGAKYVKIKNIGIKRTAEPGIYHYYFAVMGLANDITGLTITNCDLSTTGSSTIVPYALAATNIPSNISINNNRFSGGLPISLSGYTTPYMQNVTISNNRFENPITTSSASQVSLTYMGNVTVENNYFDSAKASSQLVGGLSLGYGSGKMNIYGNRIVKRKGTIGIGLAYISGLNNGDSAVIIANNFVTVDSVGATYALQATNMGRNVKIVYNNLLNNCSATGSANSYALYFTNSFGTGTLKDTIANNNIIVTGTGYGLYEVQNNTGDINSTNNNIWSATSAKLATYNSTNYTTIAALATASGSNTATVSMNPFYVSNNDLHISELALRNLGKPFPYLLKDIDGDVRGLTTSTIGADEIVIGSNDAGITGLVSPAKPFAAGNQTVSVTVKNYGTDALSNATINWSVNGTMQAPAAFSGNLAFNTTATTTLGNVNFVIDSNFVIKAWTVSPNGGPDTNTGNDTVTISNIYPALNGVYTLGGVSPDFKGFGRTTNNLKYGGMLGNVTFNVRDGKYNEAMTVDSIGFQNNYSVTWQGESADSSKAILAYSTYTGDNTQAVIQLNNTKNITFKNLGIQIKIPTSVTATSYKSVVLLSKASRNAKFISNMFTDSSYYSPSNTGGSRFFYNRDDVNSTSNNAYRSSDSSLLIDRNLFRQVNLSTNPVIELGGTTHAIFQGTVVDIFLNNTVISNNTYDMLLASKPGILITEADSIRITGNRLQGSVAINGKDLMIFDRNRVYHEGYNQSAVTINSSVGRAAGKPAIVSNNMIQTSRVGTFNGALVGNNALYINGDRVNILHNTLATSDTGSVSGYNTAAALNIISSSSDTVKNNILYNANGGYLVTHSSVTNLVSNSNDYMYTKNFSNVAPSFTAYKTLLSQDANSVEKINPYFRGPMDLHASNILVKFAAPVTPSNSLLTTDIDGQPRGAIVCAGADEFLQPANDMVLLDATPKKVFSEGVNNFTIRVYNNGSNPITTFNTTASLTNYPNNYGTAVAAGSLNYTFNGSIAPGAEATVTLGQMNVPLFRNVLKINTVSLNNSADEVPFTDSLQLDEYYSGLNGTYTFKNDGSNTPTTFLALNSLVAQLQFGGVYGPSVLNVVPGTHYGDIRIDSIPNRGALSPLIIQSQNGDTATTSIRGYTGLTMYRANHVTIKNLAFYPSTGSTTTGLYQIALGWNSQYISVENCLVVNYTGGYTNAISTNNPIFMSGNWSGQSNYSDSNYTFKNNFIVGGNTGITLGGSNTLPTKNIIITGNRFLNQYSTSIDLTQQRFINVDSNVIQTNTANVSYKAINLSTTLSRTLIQRNKINILKDGYGIYNDPVNYNAYLSPSDTLRIMNNFVTVGESQPSYGIYVSTANSGKQVQVIYNSVNNRSTSATSGSYLFGTTASPTYYRNDVLNNIFFNKNGGIPVTATGITSTYNIEHNNDLYTTGPVLAKINGTSYANLATLTATGLEYGSITGDPLFVSDADLHADGSLANNSGTYDAAPFTMIDIDTEARSVSNPDMGADEFTLPNFGIVALESPLSSCAHTATETVKAWVKNFGTQPRINVPVAYRFNNGAIIRDTVRVFINAGDSVLFSFMQTANLAAPTDYNFDVWTAYRGDSLPSNDTLHILVATTPANTMLPYYTGFEGTNAGWYTGGQNTSFARGVIFSGVIDSSANGLNGWKSNLIGSHRNSEKSYLYSPCFDLTAVTADPTLNFNLAFQLENNTDKAWVEYSSNAGSTWTKLGAQGEGLAWYNNAGNYWTGDNHLWHNAKHVLPVMGLSDRSAVRVRFVLETNSSIVQDGLAIDDISIYAGTNAPVSAGTYTNRTATSTGSGNFIPVNDPSGNRILEINDGTNSLGTISVDVNQNAGNAPTWYNGQSYLGRSFVIHVQNQPVTPVIVRLFITQAEFDAWKAADPTIDQVRSVGVYKFSGSVEDFDLSNNTAGTPLNVSPAQITKIPYLDGYFLEFSVSSFSEFWITKAVAAPVGNSCLGSGISFTAPTTGTSYQWQVNTGTGYTNITDGGIYSGTTTVTLQLTNAPTSYTGYTYRAVVNGVNGPDNVLRFILTWTGAVSTDWATAGNWSCPTIPDEFTDVVIPTGLANYPVISVNTSVRKITTQTGTSVTVGAGVNVDVKGR